MNLKKMFLSLIPWAVFSVIINRRGADAAAVAALAAAGLSLVFLVKDRKNGTRTIERDERGFILTGPDLLKPGKRPRGWTLERDPSLLETNVPGVFAVGDVRYCSVKRVASGVGEGSVAIQFVHQYLSNVS